MKTSFSVRNEVNAYMWDILQHGMFPEHQISNILPKSSGNVFLVRYLQLFCVSLGLFLE